MITIMPDFALSPDVNCASTAINVLPEGYGGETFTMVMYEFTALLRFI